MARKNLGFVALKSLRRPAGDRPTALEDIRHIYFKTSRHTIEHDIVHAVELLKSLPSEEEREKASVFMHGLNEMRREWSRKPKRKR